MADVLHQTARQKDLIYDLGLHRGQDTDFYLRKGFRVVAFEAVPELAEECRRRFAEFLTRGRLTIIEGAVIDRDRIASGPAGKVSFYRNKDLSVWGTVSADWAERNSRMGATSSLIEVCAVDLEEIIAEHGVPHYMKIDLEGCDLMCLGVLKRFRERPDYVSIESDKTSLAGILREIELLSDLGYDRFQAVEQSAIPAAQSPPSPAREGAYVAHRFEAGSSGLFGAELPGEWRDRNAILRQYRFIRCGYFLFGDEGFLIKGKPFGNPLLRFLARRVVRGFTRAEVPGWYDTHARHSGVGIEAPEASKDDDR